jgi:hypothetical protein
MNNLVGELVEDLDEELMKSWWRVDWYLLKLYKPSVEYSGCYDLVVSFWYTICSIWKLILSDYRYRSFVGYDGSLVWLVYCCELRDWSMYLCEWFYGVYGVALWGVWYLWVLDNVV